MCILLVLCNALQVPNEMGTQYHDVLSAQDVAVYGGLCALASFDRHELRNHVINNVSFRDYMEVNPEVMPRLLLMQSTSYVLPLQHMSSETMSSTTSASETT